MHRKVMDPNKWTRVKELVSAALELEPSERRAFVVKSCRDDDVVRTEVLSLLESDLKTSYIGERQTAFSDRFPPKPELRIAHYEILGVLGRGGMGTVYKARDIRLSRLVALKVLLPHLIEGQEARERFIKEARAASRLEHPNICTVFEIGETEKGILYIATSFVDGRSLRDEIREKSHSVRETIGIVSQVLAGLGAAHSAGVVHRDIKPSNIMVANGGSVKIVDFGIAKLDGDSDLTKTGSTLGTVSYMSPERVRGLPMDGRADLWSLGVIMYEMLTGERPFSAEFQDAVGYKIINDEPVSIDDVNPDVPRPVAGIVERCLSKKPDDRYSDAAEVSRVLQTIDLDSVDSGSKAYVAESEGSREPLLLGDGLKIGAATAALLAIAAVVFISLRGVWFSPMIQGPLMASTVTVINPPGANFDPLKVVVAPFSGLDPSASGGEPNIQALIAKELNSISGWIPGAVRVESSTLGPVKSEEQASALMKATGSGHVIWGEIGTSGGGTEVVSRVSSRFYVPIYDDSLMSISAAGHLAPWKGITLSFTGKDVQRTRLQTAERVAAVTVADLLTPGSELSNEAETAVLAGTDSTSFEQTELRARSLIRLNRIGEAKEYLDRSIDAFPAQPSLPSIYANILLWSGDMEGAIRMAEKAVGVDNHYAYGYLQLAHLAYIKQDASGASSHLEAAYRAARGEERSTIGFALAKRYLALQDFVQVERLTRDLIKSDPDNVLWFSVLAESYVLQGLDSEAAFVLRNLVETKPEDPWALAELALHYRRQGQTDSARATVARLVVLDSEKGHRMESDWHLQDGNATKAVEALKQALDLSRDLPWQDYESLGNLYLMLGRYDEAIGVYERGVSDSTRYLPLAHRLGMAYIQAGQLDKALELTRERRLQDPTTGPITLGIVYRNLGRTDDALHFAKRSLEYAPNDPSRSSNMASTLSFAGRYEESLPYHEQVVRAFPRRGSSRFRYALALHRSGRTDDAYGELESWVRLIGPTPPDSGTAFSRRIALFYLGRENEERILDQSSPTEIDSLWQRVSGSYYVGMAYLLNFGRHLNHPAPDTVRAKEYLERALRYGAHPSRLQAVAELKRLELYGR